MGQGPFTVLVTRKVHGDRFPCTVLGAAAAQLLLCSRSIPCAGRCLKPPPSPQELPLPGPEIFAWPEFPEEEQHPPWPPMSLPRWVPSQGWGAQGDRAAVGWACRVPGPGPTSVHSQEVMQR